MNKNKISNPKENPSDDALRYVRDAVLTANLNDADPTIIAEDRDGYFMPTAIEAALFANELNQDCETRNKAATAEVEAIKAKIHKLWPSESAEACNQFTSLSTRECPKTANYFFPYYRFLEFGEVIRQSDEFSADGKACWRGTHFCCVTVKYFLTGNYRRKIEIGEGFRSLKIGETVQSGDECLVGDAWEASTDDGEIITAGHTTVFRRARTSKQSSSRSKNS